MAFLATIPTNENSLLLRNLIRGTPKTPKILPLKIKATYVAPHHTRIEQFVDPNTHPPTFEEYMKTKANRVNQALNDAVPLQKPMKIHEAMRYSLLAGGKRVRPILCIASCELVGGDEQFSIPMACAVEMIHTMSLIHDDLPCMDDDDLRRGKPTSHKVVDDILDVTKSSEELGKTAGKDLVSDKATYPKLMGLERAKEFAMELVGQAVDELNYFHASRAVPLTNLANYIAYRSN